MDGLKNRKKRKHSVAAFKLYQATLHTCILPQ